MARNSKRGVNLHDPFGLKAVITILTSLRKQLIEAQGIAQREHRQMLGLKGAMTRWRGVSKAKRLAHCRMMRGCRG